MDIAEDMRLLGERQSTVIAIVRECHLPVLSSGAPVSTERCDKSRMTLAIGCVTGEES